jgi:hypothetical protein
MNRNDITFSGRSLLRSLAAAAALAMAWHARAGSVPALGIDPATSPHAYNTPGGPVDGMTGWSFYLAQPVTVTGVGWYDDGADGLLHSHEIGIWKDESGVTYTNPPALGANLALSLSATVPAGTSARLQGPWRVLDFNVSLTLEPGDYEIAGTTYSSPDDVVKYVLDNPPQVGTISDPILGLEIGGPAFSSAGPLPPGESEFFAPTNWVTVYGEYLGPMFFVASSVPEPSPALLLGGGLLLLSLARRRSPRRDLTRQSSSPGRDPAAAGPAPMPAHRRRGPGEGRATG